MGLGRVRRDVQRKCGQITVAVKTKIDVAKRKTNLSAEHSPALFISQRNSVQFSL
jgi:hypothetical protein